jgi:putative transposase
MLLRYNHRLYPTPGQCAALVRAFGCARVAFNDGLCARQEAFAAGLPYPTDAELSARLTAAKASPERAWLGEVSAVVLQQALADLNAAYRNFLASLRGRRKGPTVAPPRFRARKDRRQAIRFTRNARWQITPGGRLRLPKIGDVPVRWSRDLPSDPSSVTVIRDAAGRYFASFVVQTVPDSLPEAEPVIGIDLGLTHFAVMSDGRKIASPRFLRRAEKKLRRAQKALSRKEKGSQNRDKARVKVARAHARVADARREFRRIGRLEPTSQVCSACGARDGRKPLHIRTWQCQICGAWLDRDINAAINVARAAGLAVTACGAQVRPGVIPAQRGETGTLPTPRQQAA